MWRRTGTSRVAATITCNNWTYIKEKPRWRKEGKMQHADNCWSQLLRHIPATGCRDSRGGHVDVWQTTLSNQRPRRHTFTSRCVFSLAEATPAATVWWQSGMWTRTHTQQFTTRSWRANVGMVQWQVNCLTTLGSTVSQRGSAEQQQLDGWRKHVAALMSTGKWKLKSWTQVFEGIALSI